MRTACFVLSVLMLSSAAVAQDGLRSASLPERTASNPIPTPPIDQFRAQPDTYQVRPGAPGTGSFAFFPVTASPVVVVVERIVERTPTIYRRDMDLRGETPAADRPAAQPAPVIAPRAIPKTFYVIPGCYAGDKRPLREQLPAGCDPRRVRVIPPVVSAVVR